MIVKICKVIAKSAPVYVQSKKSENGQLAKSSIRLRAIGGDYEDEFICTLFGNLALGQFAVGSTVVACLRFSTHESNGACYQDIVANDIVALS